MGNSRKLAPNNQSERYILIYFLGWMFVLLYHSELVTGAYRFSLIIVSVISDIVMLPSILVRKRYPKALYTEHYE